MRKLRLNIDTLQVESFEASGGRRPAIGTVRGNDLPSGAFGTSCAVTECADTCLCPNTSPQPSCDDCSWQDCFTWNYDSCYCAHTSPRPSCEDCTWDTCPTNTPECA